MTTRKTQGKQRSRPPLVNTDEAMDIRVKGSNRTEAPPKNVLSRVKTQISRQSASGQIGRSRHSKGSGKGGFWSHQGIRQTFVREPKQFDRRVVVKARISKHAGIGGSAKTRGKKVLKLHVKYIQRDGVSQDNKQGELYNQNEDRMQDKDFIERCSDDEHHFRFIVSPEDGSELDLKQTTRDLMRQMEKDLDSKLDWVAVNHYNTDNPHTHIVVRGKDERGQDLIISPDYISHGMRGRACEIATRELGQMNELQLQQRIQQTLELDQWTYTDQQLLDLTTDGPINLFELPRNDYGHQLHQRYSTRLSHLKGLGLANEQVHGQWHVDPELKTKLRAIREQNELANVVHQHTGTQRSVIKFDKDAEHTASRTEPVVGAIVGKGLENELIDRAYLIVDGVDGHVHYVPLWASDQFSEFKQGDIVEAKVRKPAPFHAKADENLAVFAGGQDVAYERGKFQSYVLSNKMCKKEHIDNYLDRHEARMQTWVGRKLTEVNEEGQVIIPSDIEKRLDDYEAKMKGKLKNRQVLRQLDRGKLDVLSQAQGFTVLDEQLLSKKPMALGSQHYGPTFATALEQRQHWLLDNQLAHQQADGQIRVVTDLKKQLKALEFRRLEADLAEQGVELVQLQPEQIFEGKLKAKVKLRSGQYAQVQRGHVGAGQKRTYVKWQKDFEKHLGKDIRLTRNGQRFLMARLLGKQQTLF